MRKIISLIVYMVLLCTHSVFALNQSRYVAAHQHFAEKSEGSTLYLIVGGIGVVVILVLLVILRLKSKRK